MLVAIHTSDGESFWLADCEVCTYKGIFTCTSFVGMSCMKVGKEKGKELKLEKLGWKRRNQPTCFVRDEKSDGGALTICE